MKNEVLTCPIYFENHEFGGHLYSIEEFTNINFGNIRTTILNGKPYFAAMDVVNNLHMAVKSYHTIVQECIQDVEESIKEGYIDSIHPEELFFYLNIEVTHKGGNQYCTKEIKHMVRTLFISEPIMYLLIMRSRKKEAVGFKVWLATQILPQLRVIGRDRASQILYNESCKLMSALNDVNRKYADMKESAEKNGLICNGIAEMLFNHVYQNDLTTANITRAIQDLVYRVDSIGYNQNYICNTMQQNTNQINNKITDIATGLNAVFNGR